MIKILKEKIGLKRISLHFLFWVVFVLYFSFFFGYPDRWWKYAKDTLIQLEFDFFVVYFSLYFLIPKLLLKGKRVLFFLFFTLTCFSGIVLQRVFYFEVLFTDYPKDFNYLRFPDILKVFLINMVLYVSAISIKITKVWYEKKIEASSIGKKQIETELKLKEAELQLLKAQIHPHFLFNTLNNLYGLTLAKSDKAAEVVIKISELLDYMLYECNLPKVELNKELKYIKNYVEIERIRYNNKLKISFESYGVKGNHQIAPLLLLPFVENSFKHGVSKSIGNAWVDVNLKVENDSLNFHVANSKEDDNSKHQNAEGIGLKNVKKRLDLTYNGNYVLDIVDRSDVFTVSLTLKL